MTDIVLWDYPMSSACFRVRIALNLLGEPYRTEAIDLASQQHRNPSHLARNPQGLVPVLDIDGHRLTQSLAILDYLDRTRDLRLLPDDPAERAKTQALAYSLAVDVHPVCNLSVATHATKGQEPDRNEWMRHFIAPGLEAFEVLLGQFRQAPFATGSKPGLADICLIPQLYNANRWGVSYAACTRIKAVETACAGHDAFVMARP